MDIFPATIGADGQAVGQGCVYPPAVKTVADQLDGQGPDLERLHGGHGQRGRPARRAATRRSTAATTRRARSVGDQYAARHNPFVYFHSIIDTPELRDATTSPSTGCRPTSRRPRRRPTTPSSRRTCATTATTSRASTASPGGLVSADAFLQDVGAADPGARRRTGDGGLLVVTFDEAEATGDADAPAATSPPGPTRPTRAARSPARAAAGSARSSLSPCVAAGLDQRDALQPLLAPAQRRGHLRPRRTSATPAQAGLRRVRRRRLQRRRAGGHARVLRASRAAARAPRAPAARERALQGAHRAPTGQGAAAPDELRAPRSAVGRHPAPTRRRAAPAGPLAQDGGL